ncbi:bifunctional 23S rRNA (guanine(2069)-N(7))-methyltransferase RlmK/23S rRNA (guanine(2445)-N(2))-methyltransferase RlmL [Geoalkalibacter halelectricus]|uniref:bifunctional 23S rRNA (guanine(2069)-N(7))-methyltransferase RlmK/23S rRNA (guanine(2445)-N(2))-methyltransferase RlmL n=1 Tax=Geoalkalibacter halelectricus TaxID=2847045 RepID=UPI003D1A6F52
MVAQEFLVTAPHGTEDLLLDEIAVLGATGIGSIRSGASFHGSLETAYRICLWSRVASRVFLPLTRFGAQDADQLYERARGFAWEDHLGPSHTLAVDASLRRSWISHSRFAALKIKDAIVDRFRDRSGQRPSVRVDQPDLRIHALIDGQSVTLCLDLSGEGLYRRGYRAQGGQAPLKENLAAAILLRAGWPEMARAGQALLDPLCGSATLLIEGALMAGDVAPGLLRTHFGYLRWAGHDEGAWRQLIEEAAQRKAEGQKGLPPILGCDSDRVAVAAAQANVARAGLAATLVIDRADFASWLPRVRSEVGDQGLIVTNPPYGERLGDVTRLAAVYAALGNGCRRHFGGWRLSVLTGNPDLAGHLGLRAKRSHSLRNGPIRAKLLHYDLRSGTDDGAQPDASAGSRPVGDLKPLDGAAEMFANRLRKNFKAVCRWAEREGVSCYRVYDADLPEYAVAIDYYQGRVHVQEYQAPPSVDATKAHRRLLDVLRVVPEVLGVAADQVYLKQRRRQRGAEQYGRTARSGEFFQVEEGPCRFWVNLSDYLDTGLFLDHRPIRRKILEMAPGVRFLNLFGYTGAATVFAARGGAAGTVTVDASRTYLDWARRNLQLNGFTEGPHRLERCDVLEWLDKTKESFELIFLDPPTFSNSKGRSGTFDVQRDHVNLIRQAVRCLRPGGLLIFSTNHRKFRLDGDALGDLEIADISAATIPWDFRRSPTIHKCWLLGASGALDDACGGQERRSKKPQRP